jgi:RHS repeat-associated protein
MMQNGSRYTYHHDGIGSIIALVDDTQTVVQTYRYDAYGNVLTELNQGFENPYAFTGRVWEKDNGLYYYRTRFYDPKTGRFLSRDPLGFLTGTYLYGYVNNNPVNAIDPLGLWNIIIGGGVSLAGGMGCEGSGGIVISFWERKFDIGVFGSVGASGGLNVSGDLFAGWVKGGTNDLAGTTGNINVTGGPVSLTSFHDPKTGEWLGGTIGAGPGATPVGGSVAISITGKITIRDIARWIDGLLK